MREKNRIYQFGDQPIRTVISKTDIWIVSKDVCRAIDLKNPSRAMESLAAKDKRRKKMVTAGGCQTISLMNISSTFDLTFRNARRKPAAKQFHRWLTHELLPQVWEERYNPCRNAHPSTIETKGVSLTKAAELMRIPDFERKHLIHFLRQQDIFAADGIPRQNYVAEGYFQVAPRMSWAADGALQVNVITRVSPKGILAIRRWLKDYMRKFMDRSIRRASDENMR